MPELKGIKWPVQGLFNGLLVVCLGYLGVGWLTSPGPPELDEVVLKLPGRGALSASLFEVRFMSTVVTRSKV